MKKVVLSIVAVIVSVILWFLIRTQFYYVAEADVLATVMANKLLTITEDDNYITIIPASWISHYTYIFYPWAKVDAHAYIAKLWKISVDNDMKIMISKPALHLQIFEINAAENISWTNLIIWGHSLGWAMACEYVRNHPNSVSGMILMWAYCNGDISSQSWLKTLVIAGSNDWVLPLVKLDSYRHNLPAGNVFSIISGSAHAQFWDYGIQKWDGTSTVSDEEVVSQESHEIWIFLESIK